MIRTFNQHPIISWVDSNSVCYCIFLQQCIRWDEKSNRWHILFVRIDSLKYQVLAVCWDETPLNSMCPSHFNYILYNNTETLSPHISFSKQYQNITIIMTLSRIQKLVNLYQNCSHNASPYVMIIITHEPFPINLKTSLSSLIGKSWG